MMSMGDGGTLPPSNRPTMEQQAIRKMPAGDPRPMTHADELVHEARASYHSHQEHLHSELEATVQYAAGLEEAARLHRARQQALEAALLSYDQGSQDATEGY